MYYVSIQRYWHDSEARDIVELASGEPSPDMLANRHYSEHDRLWEAIRTAVAVAEREGLTIARANSMVYGNPDDPEDPDELLAEAQRAEDSAPACEGCGRKDCQLNRYTDYEQDISFSVCSEHCFDRAMASAYPYVVTTGLAGLYMPNSVYRCISWQDARRVAIEEAKRWRDMEDDKDADDRETADVYYSGDRQELEIYFGNETISVGKGA